MAVFNDEKCIKNALDAIVSQSYKDFELVIIDDCSSDSTPSIIKGYKDERIKVYRNEKNSGIAKSRNRASKLAKGKYLFFTDSDCIVDKNWLKEGLKAFNDALGVEGVTHYISKDYVPTLSDKLPGVIGQNEQYMTCNIAYLKEVFDKYGYFDERYHYHDDREFALRVLKHGKINFCKTMKVIHQKKLWNFKSMIKTAERAEDRVLLFKDYGETGVIWCRILFPRSILKIIFPPVLIYTFFHNRIVTWNDFKVFLSIYPAVVYERIIIWKKAIKEKVFLI